jgi:hypothetical protein
MSDQNSSLSAATVECLAERYTDKSPGVSKADSNGKFLSCVKTAVKREDESGPNESGDMRA